MLPWSPAEWAVGGLVEPGGHALGVELVAAGQLGQLVILPAHMYAMFDIHLASADLQLKTYRRPRDLEVGDNLSKIEEL